MTPLLLPGNMCDARLWRGGANVIVDTLRRIGSPRDADLSDDDTIAGMAVRTLGQHSGPLLAIGFSMGAIVALQMALLEPKSVRALVLMGVNASADLPERAAVRPRQQTEVLGGGLERVIVEELKPNYLAPVNRGNGALLALLRDMGMALGPDVFIRQSEALRTRSDLVPMLATINVPVLLLCGAEDRLCPPAWHERWASLLPRRKMEIVEDAGHMVPLEAPHAVAAAISTWLEEIE